MYIIKENKSWLVTHDNVNACWDIHIEMLYMLAEFWWTTLVDTSS